MNVQYICIMIACRQVCVAHSGCTYYKTTGLDVKYSYIAALVTVSSVTNVTYTNVNLPINNKQTQVLHGVSVVQGFI